MEGKGGRERRKGWGKGRREGEEEEEEERKGEMKSAIGQMTGQVVWSEQHKLIGRDRFLCACPQLFIYF